MLLLLFCCLPLLCVQGLFKMPFRLFIAIVKELFFLPSPESSFYDSPLNKEGIEQAMALCKAVNLAYALSWLFACLMPCRGPVHGSQVDKKPTLVDEKAGGGPSAAEINGILRGCVFCATSV